MTLQGIDISGWQNGINLDAVPADFVIMKATGGAGFVVGDCDRQYQQAKRAGKLRGVYHFAKDGGPVNSATKEADHFVDNTKGYHDGETLLVLDFEADAVALGAGWALEWLNRVYERTGIRPLIYLSGSLAAQKQWDPVVTANYGLWVANWGSNPITGHVAAPTVNPGRWPFAVMRQYSSNGQLPGYGGRLDMNVFYGDKTTWLKYAAKNSAPVVIPPVTPPKPPTTPSPSNTYTVKSGDSLSAIGAKFGVSWQSIYEANKAAIGANPSLIYPGQVLVIPGAGSTPTAPAPSGTSYTVKSGDTLSSIAAKYGTTWKRIYDANKGVIGKDPNLIKPGQVLRIP